MIPTWMYPLAHDEKLGSATPMELSIRKLLSDPAKLRRDFDKAIGKNVEFLEGNNSNELFSILYTWATDESLSSQSRVAAVIALRHPMSWDALLLTWICSVNDSIIAATSDDSKINSIERIPTVIFEYLDQSAEKRFLLDSFNLRVSLAKWRIEALNHNAGYPTDSLIATISPTHVPYRLNRLPNEALSLVLEVEDPIAGKFQSIQINASSADLANSFRLGESTTHARTEYSHFMGAMLDDLLSLSHLSSEFAKNNRLTMRFLTWLSIAGDDLELASKAQLRFISFRQILLEHDSSILEKELPSGFRNRMRFFYISEPFRLSQRVWSPEDTVRKNQLDARAFLKQSK